MRASKRTRRTAEGARREILDAAEKRLRELGPGGVRLQQIASDVGVSHPAILHHFESFEDLIQQVVQRAVENLRVEIVSSLDAVHDKDGPIAFEMLERAHEVLVEKGHARLFLWLLLSDLWPLPMEQRLRTVAEVAHRRRQHVEPESTTSFEETLFRTLLVSLVLLGEAAAGDAMRESAGLGADPDAGRRFRRWLARLLSAPHATGAASHE